MGEGDQGRGHEAGVSEGNHERHPNGHRLAGGWREVPIKLFEQVLAELCLRMAEAGVPLWRAAVFVTTLHPDFLGRAFLPA